MVIEVKANVSGDVMARISNLRKREVNLGGKLPTVTGGQRYWLVMGKGLGNP